ncbi:single-stranded DNA-binding protein [Comamonas thiooxydans]|uniref:single-stranded DNA-binding protein n=1 Tax=Comamonas thiooxydans TaxID=363952 RepID=UPI001038F045|nr:single-stranded DNA-binding protein [Comamonas thiooxydans]
MISTTAIGYVDKQPELIYVGQTPKIKFKVVDKRSVKNKTTGEYEYHYETVSFECWGEDALRYAEKLTKGRPVEVVGHRPTTEKWESAGVTYSDFVYKALTVHFPYHDSRQQAQGSVQGNAPQAQPNSAPRYATRPQPSGNAQHQPNAEPTARPAHRSYERSGVNRNQEPQPSQAQRQQPAYHDPRNAGQGQSGQQQGHNRFNRGNSQGAPRTQY